MWHCEPPHNTPPTMGCIIGDTLVIKYGASGEFIWVFGYMVETDKTWPNLVMEI